MTRGRPFFTVRPSDRIGPQEQRKAMHKYLVERTVPGAGQMDAGGLAAIARESNNVLRDLGPDIQWVHSYVTDDKITCLYLATSEEIVREHGRCGGFPIDAVYEVRSVIDPTTAEPVR
jgi:Nickel responsive protein SCO4226-like